MIVRHIRDAKRFSIIHDMTCCWKCHRTPVEKHEIFGGTSNRQKSKDYGLVVALCHDHHEQVTLNPKCNLNRTLHILGQTKFEEIHGHDMFMEVFKRNYK